MKDLKKKLLKVGKDAQKVAQGEINFGGCCVYAALVARELIARGHPARGVVYAGLFDDNSANLDEVRNELREPKTVRAWNKRGVVFNHVAIETEIGDETVVFDSDGFRQPRGDMYAGRLTVEELEALAGLGPNETETHRGWNSTFDRDLIPDLRETVQRHFNKGDQ